MRSDIMLELRGLAAAAEVATAPLDPSLVATIATDGANEIARLRRDLARYRRALGDMPSIADFDEVRERESA